MGENEPESPFARRVAAQRRALTERYARRDEAIARLEDDKQHQLELERQNLADSAQRIKEYAREAAAFLTERGVEPVSMQGRVLGRSFVPLKTYRYERIRVWRGNPTGPTIPEPVNGKPQSGGLAFDLAGEIYVVQNSPDRGLRAMIIDDEAKLAIGPRSFVQLWGRKQKHDFTEVVFAAWRDFFAEAAAQNLGDVG
jgi:hypothetical protein